MEQTREHISASEGNEAPWTSLLIQDAIGADTGGIVLSDEERNILKTASESQSVLKRLASTIPSTTSSSKGSSYGTVLDNYGRMINSLSLAKDVDQGARTYGAIMRRTAHIQNNTPNNTPNNASHNVANRTSSSRSSLKRPSFMKLVDVVDASRRRQVMWLFDICSSQRGKDTTHSRSIDAAQCGAAERVTYDDIETCMLSLPMSSDSSVQEHTRCLKQMLLLLETCFRGGGAVRTR